VPENSRVMPGRDVQQNTCSQQGTAGLVITVKKIVKKLDVKYDIGYNLLR